MKGHEPGRQRPEIFRQDGRGPVRFTRRQKEVHPLVGRVGANEADVIEAPLDGVLIRVGGRHGGGVGESQGAFGRADDIRASRKMGQEGGFGVVAVEDDDQVVGSKAQVPGQGEQPPVAAGVGINPAHMRIMGQESPEHPVGQNLQFPGREPLLQGPDGRGGKQRVPQGGVADEQDPPDTPGVQVG